MAAVAIFDFQNGIFKHLVTLQMVILIRIQNFDFIYRTVLKIRLLTKIQYGGRRRRRYIEFHWK